MRPADAGWTGDHSRVELIKEQKPSLPRARTANHYPTDYTVGFQGHLLHWSASRMDKSSTEAQG